MLARRSSSASASAAWLETKSTLSVFDHQRKAGMSSFRPYMMPAWLALVWLGRSAIHGASLTLSSRSHLDMTGTRPAFTC